MSKYFPITGTLGREWDISLQFLTWAENVRHISVVYGNLANHTSLFVKCRFKRTMKCICWAKSNGSSYQFVLPAGLILDNIQRKMLCQRIGRPTPQCRQNYCAKLPRQQIGCRKTLLYIQWYFSKQSLELHVIQTVFFFLTIMHHQ